MKRKKLIALLFNLVLFAAIEAWISYLDEGWTDFFMLLFIDPLVFGVTWGIFENIGSPVFSGKKCVPKFIFPFLRTALVQLLLFIVPLLKSFISGQLAFTDIFVQLLIAMLIGYVAFFITCAVAFCPPEFIRKEEIK